MSVVRDGLDICPVWALAMFMMLALPAVVSSSPPQRGRLNNCLLIHVKTIPLTVGSVKILPGRNGSPSILSVLVSTPTADTSSDTVIVILLVQLVVVEGQTVRCRRGVARENKQTRALLSSIARLCRQKADRTFFQKSSDCKAPSGG